MRMYKKVNKDHIPFLAADASSGNFTAKELSEKYEISSRKLYYIFNKYKIQYKLARDSSFITDAYRKNISEKLKGITRSDETKEKYRKVAAEREYKNNKEPGWRHNQSTKDKIKASNIDTYRNDKPVKWIKACLDNPEWYNNLKEAAKHKLAKTEDHIRKIIESKVGMTYDEWLIIKNEFERYAYEVRKLTYDSCKSPNLIQGEKQEGYHLDHIVSIYDGFKNNIDPSIIAHYTNLRYIPAKENLTKNKKSDKTIETLKEEYYAAQTKHS